MVKVIYNFIKSYQTSRVAVSSMFHHDIISLSVSLLLFGTVDIFFFNHSDRCVVLISISLMVNDVERIFVCPIALHIPSVKKYLFHSFAHF